MLSNALLALAILSIIGVLILFVDVAIGNLSIPRLDLQSPAEPPFPHVSVVIAARNEARDIERALQSVLMLDYPSYDVTIVNDRSTDSTGAIVDRMKHDFPQLKVVHVNELPAGWLGKNHALYSGALHSAGELLLFSDADVRFSPSALSRGVGYMQRERVDHLTIAPMIDRGTIPLSLVVQYFIMAFTLYMRPYKARDPKSRYFMGIGAFNLVKRSAYERAGTHERIPLRPDDDIMLAKILKQSGSVQQIMTGHELLAVRWYGNLRELVHGLQKNTFAGLGYSVLLAIFAVTGTFVLNIWPFIAIFVTGGITRALNIGVVVLLMMMYAGAAAIQRNRPWLALAYPVAAGIFAYIIVLACARTIFRRGIDWRGTSYSLDELKANKV